MLNKSATMNKVSEDANDQVWVGFLCRDCGAPLPLHQSNNGSKAGERSTRGWRVTCTSCGVSDYHEPGAAMVRIGAT